MESKMYPNCRLHQPIIWAPTILMYGGNNDNAVGTNKTIDTASILSDLTNASKFLLSFDSFEVFERYRKKMAHKTTTHATTVYSPILYMIAPWPSRLSNGIRFVRFPEKELTERFTLFCFTLYLRVVRCRTLNVFLHGLVSSLMSYRFLVYQSWNI